MKNIDGIMEWFLTVQAEEVLLKAGYLSKDAKKSFQLPKSRQDKVMQKYQLKKHLEEYGDIEKKYRSIQIETK